MHSAPVRRTRSLLQGDPAAPEIFNAALDNPAAEFCRQTRREGWGIHLDCGTLISLVLFADNFWLFASSATDLSRMFETWLGLLEHCRWDLPLEETTWCTTRPDAEGHLAVRVRGELVKRAARATGF